MEHRTNHRQSSRDIQIPAVGGHPRSGGSGTEGVEADAVPQKPGSQYALIARHLTSMGIPTKIGRQWHAAAVRGMVKR